MSNLTPNDASLLTAMMGTVGTIWAIGLAVYAFVYGYFEDNVLDEVQDLEFRMKNSGDDKGTQDWLVEKRKDANKRLMNYEAVFAGYLVSGALVGASILVSAATVAYDRSDWIQVAGVLFAAALAWLMSLLSYEVWTSVKQVRRHRKAVKPA